MKFDDLFDANGIFLKTTNHILRRIAAEEKPYYEELARAEHPEIPRTCDAPLVWDDLMSEDDLLTCSILQRDTGIFCGFCQLQQIFSSAPELGIDLLPIYQHSGIAAEVLPPFLDRNYIPFPNQTDHRLHGSFHVYLRHIPRKVLPERIQESAFRKAAFHL
jgi:hypothetical protein